MAISQPDRYEVLLEELSDRVTLRMMVKSWQWVLAGGVVLGVLLSWMFIAWQVGSLTKSMHRRFTGLENKVELLVKEAK